MNPELPFTSYLTGDLTLSHFLTGMLFVGLGLLLTALLDISQRDKDSPRTPRCWSWPFFWRDNILRFILNLLVAVALIRFWPDIQGEEISMFHCFCIGLCFDGLYIAVRASVKKLRVENGTQTTQIIQNFTVLSVGLSVADVVSALSGSLGKRCVPCIPCGS